MRQVCARSPLLSNSKKARKNALLFPVSPPSLIPSGTLTIKLATTSDPDISAVIPLLRKAKLACIFYERLLVFLPFFGREGGRGDGHEDAFSPTL